MALVLLYVTSLPYVGNRLFAALESRYPHLSLDQVEKADAIVPSLEHGAAAAPSWKGAWETAVTAFVSNPDVPTIQTALAQACKDAKVCK